MGMELRVEISPEELVLAVSPQAVIAAHITSAFEKSIPGVDLLGIDDDGCLEASSAGAKRRFCMTDRGEQLVQWPDGNKGYLRVLTFEEVTS